MTKILGVFTTKNFLIFPQDKDSRFWWLNFYYDGDQERKPKKYPVRSFDDFVMPNIWRYTLNAWWHKEYLNPSDLDCLFMCGEMTEEQFKCMWQRKSLYLLNNYKTWCKYDLSKYDKFLWLVDDFMSCLEAMLINFLNIHFKSYWNHPEPLKYRTYKHGNFSANSSKAIRNLSEKMKISFVPLIMELHKMIKEDNNFRLFLDENLSIEGYRYFKDYQRKDGRQLIRLKVERIKGNDICFTIGDYKLLRSELEKIVKCTFDYYYLKPEYAEKELKKDDKK